jgi:hypothetical protein
LDPIHSREVFSSKCRHSFITDLENDRVYALRHYRPLSLWATISPPHPGEQGGNSPSISGFFEIIKLYQFFDNNFFINWCGNGPEQFALSYMALEELQKRIDEYFSNEHIEQRCLDVIISVKWLKVMVWRLQARLRPLDTTLLMQLYQICCQVIQQLSLFSRRTLEIHGLELVSSILGCVG